MLAVVVSNNEVTAGAPASDADAGAVYSTNFCLYTIDIFSYAGSTYKTMLNSLSNDLNGSGKVISEVGLWRSTAAITSLTLTADSTSMAANTTLTLYGVKSA